MNIDIRFPLACAALLAAMASSPARADDPPPQGVWTGKGQAGYTSSQGNSVAKSANAALDMSYTEDVWKHVAHLGGLYGQSAGVTSAERWDAAWQTNYAISKPAYVFGALRYQHDLFSGFIYQESLDTGLGYKVIDSAATQLDLQVGAGYKRLRPEQLVRDPTGTVVIARLFSAPQSDAIGTVGVNFSHTLTSTTTLTDKLLVESGSTNTFVSNDLALAVKISAKLALSLGYNLQDNSNPPPGAKRLDSLETVNLVYAF